MRKGGHSLSSIRGYRATIRKGYFILLPTYEMHQNPPIFADIGRPKSLQKSKQIPGNITKLKDSNYVWTSFDTGLPYRSPTANPTNLERAQV